MVGGRTLAMVADVGVDGLGDDVCGESGVVDRKWDPQSLSFPSSLFGSKIAQDGFNVWMIMKIRWSLTSHVHSQ